MYGDFTAQSTTVNEGQPYTASVLIPNFFGGDQVVIYIDFNHNFLFTDAGENVYNGASVNPENWSGSITIPGTATLGQTRMRVRSEYTATPSSPCGALTYGETEDYKVTVTAPAPCSGQPSAGTVTGITGACSGTSFTLTHAGGSTGLTITRQWQSSPAGAGTWSSC